MKQSGTTLLELMLVLIVSAILLTIAIPSFTTLAASTRLTNATNAMVASLALARSEAIKRNSNTVLCASATGNGCGGAWHEGWVVFHDANKNATLDADEAVILKHPGMAAGLRMTGNTQLTSYISYVPTGATRTVSGGLQMGTLTLCATSLSIAARQIVINRTGRPRTVKTTLTSCP